MNTVLELIRRSMTKEGLFDNLLFFGLGVTLLWIGNYFDNWPVIANVTKGIGYVSLGVPLMLYGSIFLYILAMLGVFALMILFVFILVSLILISFPFIGIWQHIKYGRTVFPYTR